MVQSNIILVTNLPQNFSFSRILFYIINFFFHFANDISSLYPSNVGIFSSISFIFPSTFVTVFFILQYSSFYEFRNSVISFSPYFQILERNVHPIFCFSLVLVCFRRSESFRLLFHSLHRIYFFYLFCFVPLCTYNILVL